MQASTSTGSASGSAASTNDGLDLTPAKAQPQLNAALYENARRLIIKHGSRSSALTPFVQFLNENKTLLRELAKEFFNYMIDDDELEKLAADQKSSGADQHVVAPSRQVRDVAPDESLADDDQHRSAKKTKLSMSPSAPLSANELSIAADIRKATAVSLAATYRLVTGQVLFDMTMGEIRALLPRVDAEAEVLFVIAEKNKKAPNEARVSELYSAKKLERLLQEGKLLEDSGGKGKRSKIREAAATGDLSAAINQGDK